MAPSSFRNWVYDVFPSFRGEDIRKNFLSHFLKELDRKLITAFKDNEIERSQSIWPELVKAIKDSRIAIVLFSKNYASSSWCLNELLEIVKCKKEFGQIVIPVFYGLDPSHVRKQTGDFGKIFDKTCYNKTEEVKVQWKEALTDVANILGYHSTTWGSEATMIEVIAVDVLDKLLLTRSKDFENFVGIDDHIAKMSVLLNLESEQVRMVGIWGSSGIGKTTIARALFNRLSRHFQGSIFIDRAFVSKSKETYSRANPDDHNMKLHLQGNFLSEILGKKDIKIDHLGVMGERLKHNKVLIFIDDLDDHVVLEALVGQAQWFGSGSRIVVVTNDKHLLRAHEIDHVYKVSLPSEEHALEMLCQSAFRQNSPPKGFKKLAIEVVRNAGRLPLGLNVLGSSLRGRDKEYWMDMLPRLQNGLDGKIDNTLRVSYDGLDSEKDKAMFRHISCLFNGVKVKDMKLLLADSGLGVNIALENLVDKSLIHVRQGKVEMHCLLQEMGREIVRTQSIDKPGKREFLVDSKDICDVLTENTGSQKVLGISFDICEIDELHVHESAFKRMRNLRFLTIYSKKYTPRKEVRLHLPESFDHFPPRLKLLCWPEYPMRCMPSKFRPENLVKLEMPRSKLEKLWEGAPSLTCLKKMDLVGCVNMKKIPDLSMATNLKKLYLGHCSSLVELSFSIRNLNKLKELEMEECKSLETLPSGINLKSLDSLNFSGCSRLRTFLEISTNISFLHLGDTIIEEYPSYLRLENLVGLVIDNTKSEKHWEGVQSFTPFMMMLSPSLKKLHLSHIPSLVELPSSFQNLNKLKELSIQNCVNLETLPTHAINLESLDYLILSGCSRLRNFPDISTNISSLHLNQTGIEEVPWWIQNFSRLKILSMKSCSKLRYVNLNISKLKHLVRVDFSHCGVLTRADLSGYLSGVEMEADSIDIELPAHKVASSRLTDNYFPKVELIFNDCFNLDRGALIQQQSDFNPLILSGEQVPSYFTHRTTGTSFTNINISPLQTSLSIPSLKFRACVVVSPFRVSIRAHIKVCCRFRGRRDGLFGSRYQTLSFQMHERDCRLVIFDCCFPLKKENDPLPHHNYKRVDIDFHVIVHSQPLQLAFNGCGIRLAGDCTPYLSNPNILPHIHEGEGDTIGGQENESSEEWQDCIDDTDFGNEIDHSVDCGDSGVDTRRSSKRMRIT